MRPIVSASFPAFITFEVFSGLRRLSYILSALLITAMPLFGLLVDVEEDTRAWVVRGMGDAATLLGVPLLACVLGCGALQSHLAPMLLTSRLSRASLVAGRFVAIMLLLALPAFGAQILSHAVEASLGGGQVSRALRAGADGISGDFATTRDGGIIWLYKEREHELRLTVQLDDARESRHVKLPILLGPGNYERQPGEGDPWMIRYEYNGVLVEPDGIIKRGARLEFNVAPATSTLKLVLCPGRSDVALGIDPAAMSVSGAAQSSLCSGFALSLAALAGATMLVAAAMTMNARFSRGTALVFAALLLIVGIVKESLGFGTGHTGSLALSDRVLEIVTRERGQADSGASSSLAWYPDLSVDPARMAFEDGLAITLGEALAPVQIAPLLALGMLMIGWWLLKRRDFVTNDINV